MAIFSVAAALRNLFFVLGCITTAAVIFTIVIDGHPFRKELLTPWMTATLVDFYINVIAIGAWITYKQSRWMSMMLWLVSMACLGSISTCFYIVMQFLKLSPKESSKAPIYHVLRRHKTKKGDEEMNIFSVSTTRSLFSALGCLMLGTLIYTIATAGSPFRRDVLFPWLSVTLMDFYANVVPLMVWVAYKESSLIRAAMWIILLICFGSISTCAYIVLQLYELESSDPVHSVLFSENDRVQHGHEETTEKDSDVVG